MFRHHYLFGTAILAVLALLLLGGPGPAQVYGTGSNGTTVTTPRGTVFSTTGPGATPRGTIFRTGDTLTVPQGTLFRSPTSTGPLYGTPATTYSFYSATTHANVTSPELTSTPSASPTPLDYRQLYDASIYGTPAGFQGVSPAASTAPAAVGNRPAYGTNSTAQIDVRLPAAAEVRFDGVRMNQGGPLGRFVSPPLVPGQTYSYQVNATWVQNGQPVSWTRRVYIRAGERLTLDFQSVPPD